MKKLIYQVCIGPKSKLYEYCTASVKAYAEKINAEYIIQSEPILRIIPNPFMNQREGKTGGWKNIGYMPIFEKENVFDYLDDYDQICVIDGDIWIRPDSPNIFNELKDTSAHFGSVFQRELPLDPKYKSKAEAKIAGITPA